MSEDFDYQDNLIEITDESGNAIKCELYDIVEFEGNQYAVLAEVDETGLESEDPELVLMKYSEEGGSSYFETIADDDEFERVSEYIDTLDYDDEEYYDSDYDDEEGDNEE
jgi:hypothetical protein